MSRNTNPGALDPEDQAPAERLSHGARQAAAVAEGVAGEIADRLPEAAALTRSAAGQANAQLQASSDEMLIAGMGLSLGVALGLGAAGASRLLVVLALVPAGATVATLRERRAQSTSASPAHPRRRATTR
jgi:hypothetical protein